MPVILLGCGDGAAGQVAPLPQLGSARGRSDDLHLLRVRARARIRVRDRNRVRVKVRRRERVRVRDAATISTCLGLGLGLGLGLRNVSPPAGSARGGQAGRGATCLVVAWVAVGLGARG